MTGVGLTSQLIVVGDIRVYPIEPVRYGLGLTRAQMVDRHLAQLAAEGLAAHPDVDHLLDARARYLAEAAQ